jgi:hypothetical protein
VGSPPFTLVVAGANFINASTIYWNGSALTTTLINSTQLQAEISAEAVAAAGTIDITVFNPAPGGGVSNVSLFTIVKPAPAPGHYMIYLPVVMREAQPPAAAPDLVVVSAVVAPNTVQVVIKNQGNAPVPVGNWFWVDLYVSPNPVPTGVNQVWGDGRASQGIVWGVNDAALPLDPGETLTLSYGDSYYQETRSNYAGSLPVGVPIYVQVDSANTSTTYGGVLEGHEIVNGPYNNILGPAYTTANTTGTEPGVVTPPANGLPSAPGISMPPRP